mgnify:CR=1 FL=1
MLFIDTTVEQRGFAPAATALALRTIACCHGACHRPDGRLLTGIGVLTATPDAERGVAFTAAARCLHDGDTVIDLLDWLEPRLSADRAIISWHNWGSVPFRLRALADPARHPQIVAAAQDTADRWRDMPRGHTWHLRQARAGHLPCLCGPDGRIDECDAAMPAVLLPDPAATATELIGEAVAGWQVWARQFGAFDDAEHPAQAALRALDAWRADEPSAR